MKALVRGKRVAVVGRAGSIVGTGNGPAIDRADAVVRVNWLLPTAEEHIPDMGARTDLVYTCRQCATARRLAEEHGVPWARVSNVRRQRVTNEWIKRPKKVRVSTGFMAAVDVLDEEPKEIRLYGFDMQRSEHVQERTPDGHDPSGSFSGDWHHAWGKERAAWRRLVRAHPLIIPDAIFAEVLK